MSESGFQIHTGTACPMDQANVDTDQIIPARFMSTPREAGYAPFLFHDLRDDGFALVRHPAASVLVAGENFGCGSSREAAAYALVDFGIRAVLAPSFGDIFAGNAVNNGLAPCRIGRDETAALTRALAGASAPAFVDIASRRVRVADVEVTCELPEAWAAKLINGWDDIDLTGARVEQIAAFRSHRHATAPWAWPGAS